MNNALEQFQLHPFYGSSRRLNGGCQGHQASVLHHPSPAWLFQLYEGVKCYPRLNKVDSFSAIRVCESWNGNMACETTVVVHCLWVSMCPTQSSQELRDGMARARLLAAFGHPAFQQTLCGCIP